MNFDLTEDQREIKRTAREFLAARYPPDKIRRIALDGEPDRRPAQRDPRLLLLPLPQPFGHDTTVAEIAERAKMPYRQFCVIPGILHARHGWVTT